jgi:hypothetical protein
MFSFGVETGRWVVGCHNGTLRKCFKIPFFPNTHRAESFTGIFRDFLSFIQGLSPQNLIHNFQSKKFIESSKKDWFSQKPLDKQTNKQTEAYL